MCSFWVSPMCLATDNKVMDIARSETDTIGLSLHSQMRHLAP